MKYNQLYKRKLKLQEISSDETTESETGYNRKRATAKREIGKRLCKS